MSNTTHPRPTTESEAEDRFRVAVDAFIQEHRELRVANAELREKPTSTSDKPALSSLNWQTIDTAPKDGTPILACDANGPRDSDRFTCYWYEMGFWALMRPGSHCVADDIEPTHWMPLPERPQT